MPHFKAYGQFAICNKNLVKILNKATNDKNYLGY